jgi:GNAT superfamily N-acetyltransferase
MQATDEEDVLDLWIEAWEGSDRDYARREIRADPFYVEHTYLAVAPDGRPLSAAHYWLHHLHDAQGTPRLVGCVSHVATRASARRQGHARRLMELLLEAMQRDGCEWTLLFASPMGVPLYEGLGYRTFSAPYRRGRLTRRKPAGGEGFTVQRHSSVQEAGGSHALAPIYEAYNRRRPLTVVRDSAYWNGYIAIREEGWAHPNSRHANTFFTASDGQGQMCGYLLAHFSTRQYARQRFDLDQAITVSEVAALPGREGALLALMGALVDEAQEGQVGARMFLPDEEPVNTAARIMFGETMERVDDRNLMASTLSGGISDTALAEIFSAPGALSWPLDEF